MTRAGSTLLAALAAAVLAGCPIPQPLPDYPEGQPITPPRIVVDDTIRKVARGETIVRIPAACDLAPTVTLNVPLRDANTLEPIVARWFVNYDPESQDRSKDVQQDDILGPGDGGTDDPTLRQSPDFVFYPYQFEPVAGTGAGSAAGGLRIVELVVSNGFDSDADRFAPEVVLPFRTPRLGFEVQVYRWVFLTVPPSTAVPCPEPG